MRTKRATWHNEIPARTRRYGTAAAAVARPEILGAEQPYTYAPTDAEKEDLHSQIRHAAKELGLSLPEGLDVARYTGPKSPIDRFDILRAETNVQAPSLQGTLLVDTPENAANLHGWCQVLRFRERVDGFDGVLDVWKGMRQRGVDLPVSGEEADFLWTKFVHAAIIPEPSPDQHLLLNHLYKHVLYLRKQTGQQYAGLHRLIVGRLLRVAPGPRNPHHESRVLSWHTKLCEGGFCGSYPVRDLAIDALLSTQPESAFNRFKSMYDASPERDLYDHCMPLVLEHGGERKALSWHRMFLRNGDKPSEAYAADPSIQFLYSWVEGQHLRDEAGANARHTRVTGTALRATDAQTQAPLLSRASMNSLVGEVHGVKAKTISDNFCARMLATQAFSFDFALKGLAFVGAEALGPLSVRELAIRAQTPEEFRDRMSRVKQSGIRVLDSMYIRLLRRLAVDENSELFQALLDSDQHPESYDDRHVQENLLNDFLLAENWHQVHLTILGLAQADFMMTATAWNRVLQHHASARRYWEAMQIIEHLHSADIEIHLRSINFSRRYLLPLRSRGKRPDFARGTLPSGVDSQDLIVNVHLRGAQRKKPIAPNAWRELLKRYGMMHRMDGLERLAITVAQMYSVGSSEQDPFTEHVRTYRERGRLGAVFTPNMLEAIVVWGWRSASVRDLLRPLNPEETQQLYSTQYWKGMPLDCEPWARGLILLKRLKQLGVSVSDTDIADALRSRLWMLFGPGVSRKPINLEAIRRNRHSLKHYVEHANIIWEQPLFDISKDVLDKDDFAQLAVAVFGKVRAANKREGHYVGVAAWAAAKAGNAYHDAPPTRRARYFTWKYSPFRFSDGLSPAARRFRLRLLRRRSHRKRAAPPELPEAPSGAPGLVLSSPQHPQTAAHSSSSHPQPSQLYTPEPA